MTSYEITTLYNLAMTWVCLKFGFWYLFEICHL